MSQGSRTTASCCRTAADGPRQTICLGFVQSRTCHQFRGGPEIRVEIDDARSSRLYGNNRSNSALTRVPNSCMRSR
jgi:hypothetical protein